MLILDPKTASRQTNQQTFVSIMDFSSNTTDFVSQSERPSACTTMVPKSESVACFSSRESNHFSLNDLFSSCTRDKKLSTRSERQSRNLQDFDRHSDSNSDGSSKTAIFMVGPENLRAKKNSKDGRTDEILGLAGKSSRRLQRARGESSRDPDSLSHILRAAIKSKPSSSTNVDPSCSHNFNLSKMSSPRTNNKNMPRRSRAIAIQSPPPQYEDRLDEEAVAQAENERLYDYATWRMYSRIVDHRRNQLQYSTKSHQGSSNDGAAISPNCVRQTTVPDVMLQAESSLDDAVFEFDF